MPPALKPQAPSRRLLRFLRAQSEGFAHAECASRLLTRRHHVCACAAARTRPSGKTLSINVARHGPALQASFFSINAILPKALKTKQRGTADGVSAKSRELVPAAGAPRYASSSGPSDREDGNKLTWPEWLFGPDPKKQGDPLKEGDIRVRHEEESGSIFQRRSLASKAALDPRLRCTEVDGNGKVITVDGELKKSELIAKVRSPRR